MTYCLNCGGRDITEDAIFFVNTGEFDNAGQGDQSCHECGECDTTQDRHEAAKARLEMRRWRAKVASCDRCHGEGRIPLVVGAGVPGAGAFARFERCQCGGAS